MGSSSTRTTGSVASRLGEQDRSVPAAQRADLLRRGLGPNPEALTPLLRQAALRGAPDEAGPVDPIQEQDADVHLDPHAEDRPWRLRSVARVRRRRGCGARGRRKPLARLRAGHHPGTADSPAERAGDEVRARPADAEGSADLGIPKLEVGVHDVGKPDTRPTVEPQATGRVPSPGRRPPMKSDAVRCRASRGSPRVVSCRSVPFGGDDSVAQPEDAVRVVAASSCGAR